MCIRQDYLTFADPYSTDEITKPVFKIWIDHGMNATTSKSYDYMVLPSVSKTEFSNFVACPTVEILGNNSVIQAVKNKTNTVFQAVCYKSTRVNTFSEKEYLRSKTPGLIQLEKSGNKLYVTVADPTQKQIEYVFALSGKYIGKYCKYNASTNETTLAILLPQGGYAGKCITVELTK